MNFKKFVLKIVHDFDDIIKFGDFDSDNVLIDEKSYENIFIYDVYYKTLIASKPLHIRFNEIDGFVRIYNGTRYLVLFSCQKLVLLTIELVLM